ncbi:ABC transporter substrate-binding protein [Janibacter sp. G56]|uniref:ABC transporter substrate-binding protein n=1 Tax=Janibacter sp. G56 TaxID=3418717 RepID=UPI003D0897FC
MSRSSRPRPLRRLQLAAALAAALGLAACSTTGVADDGSSTTATAASTDAFPVTIEHAFGETTIEEQPTRVATVAWANQDVAAQLGVVPVGVPTIEWGGNDNGSTDWFDAAIEGETAPTQYSEADGVNVEAIAKLQPDVILAVYSGLSQEDYDKLSKIAPVVAQPGDPYIVPWQDLTTTIGTALGKSEQAQDLVEETEAAFAETAAAHPELEGTSVIYGSPDAVNKNNFYLYLPGDARVDVLTALGMTIPPVIEETAKGTKEFFANYSTEKADALESDVLVTYYDAATKTSKEDIEADPLLGKIPAVAAGAMAGTEDKQVGLAMSAVSPLSLDYAFEHFIPEVAAAAKAAKAN